MKINCQIVMQETVGRKSYQLLLANDAIIGIKEWCWNCVYSQGTHTRTVDESFF